MAHDLDAVRIDLQRLPAEVLCLVQLPHVLVYQGQIRPRFNRLGRQLRPELTLPRRFIPTLVMQ